MSTPLTSLPFATNLSGSDVLAGVQPPKAARKFALADIAAFVGGANVITPESYGAKGDGTDDTSALIRAFSAAAGKRIHFTAGKTYLLTSTAAVASGTIIDAYGATITSAMTGIESTLELEGDEIYVLGLTLLLSGGGDSPWNINVVGERCRLRDVALTKDEGTGGYQMYVRHSATGFEMHGGRTAGSNGIYHEASDAAYLGVGFVGRVSGGDDAIAIKAISASPTNIRIIGCDLENLSYYCSIGSEIGVAGANDVNYTRSVSHVLLADLTGRACQGFLDIKPGAISTADWRDGTVEDITCSNLQLSDPTGLKFNRAFAITPSRGARIRRITSSTCCVTARSTNDTGHRVGTIDCFIPDNGALGTAQASISDINLSCKFVDPYGGAANSGSAPGYPVNNLANFEIETAGRGTMSDIRVSIDGDGCTFDGVVVDANVPSDAVEFARLRLRNVNNNGSGAIAGLNVDTTRVLISDPSPSISVLAGTRYKTSNGGAIATVNGARTLSTATADVGNSTTVETDLFSYSVAARELANNGDRIGAQYAGTFVSSATATRQLKLKFAGTTIFDSGALTLSLSAAWDIVATLVRVSATVVRYSVSMTTEGAALPAYTACGELTGLTLSNANILKLTGTAAGTGAATNDIVGKMASVDKRAA
jgi:hypothetical protein